MSQRQRLSVVLGLNLVMIVGLIVVGVRAGSLGVLAAGGDYAADSSAILLGIMAVTIGERVGPSSKARTYVAGLNAAALIVVTMLVLLEAARRLLLGAPVIAGLPVLIVSAISAAVMVAGVSVLGLDAGREDLHMRSVLLDTAADALTSAAVAVSGAVIYTTGRYYWLDPALSLGIALVIGVGAIRLLLTVVGVLRHGTPLDLDLD